MMRDGAQIHEANGRLPPLRSLYNRFAEVSTALSTLQTVLEEWANEEARYAACPAVI